jgi:hypothetical protein
MELISSELDNAWKIELNHRPSSKSSRELLTRRGSFGGFKVRAAYEASLMSAWAWTLVFDRCTGNEIAPNRMGWAKGHGTKTSIRLADQATNQDFSAT